MAFGMEVRTANGIESIADLRSAQLAYRDLKSTASGTDTAPTGFTSSNSIVALEVNDGGIPPTIEFSGSSITWTEADTDVSNFTVSTSSDFYLMIWRVR